MTNCRAPTPNAESDKTVAPIGSPTGYAAKERHPGSLWLEAHLADLPHNQYVAASKDGLVAHDVSATVVLAKVEALAAEGEFERLDVCIDYNPAPRTRMPPQWELHPGKLWIDQNLAGLPANQWVAASKDGLVAHDVAQKVVLARIQALADEGKINLLDVFMTFIQPAASGQ